MTSKIEPAYDNTAEQNLNKLICSLDENPILCVDPLERSTYLGFSLYNSEWDFQLNIESKYDVFINYLNDFAEACVAKGLVISNLQPTIARLLIKYNQSKRKCKNSSLREAWRYNSEYFEIPIKGDLQKENEQKYTRDAYKFFYKASCIQMFYLRKVIDNLKILRVSENSNITITESNSPDTSENKKSNKEIKYNFEIRPGKPTKKKYDILEDLFDALKEIKYINCTLPEFRKVFSEDPKPIIWLKPYNYLTYLITRMAKYFLTDPKTLSKYKIAKQLFYKKEEGVYFEPKKDRHDKDPVPTAIEKLDEIIKSGILEHLK